MQMQADPQVPHFGFELSHLGLQLHDDLGLFRASQAASRRGRPQIVHPFIITRLPGKATIISLHFSQQNPPADREGLNGYESKCGYVPCDLVTISHSCHQYRRLYSGSIGSILLSSGVGKHA